MKWIRLTDEKPIPVNGTFFMVWDGTTPQAAVWRRDMGETGGFASFKINKRTTHFHYIPNVIAYFQVPDLASRK